MIANPHLLRRRWFSTIRRVTHALMSVASRREYDGYKENQGTS